MCFRQHLTWTFLIKSCMFLICSFVYITVTEICFRSGLSVVNTSFLYLCVAFPRNISEERGEKNPSLFVTSAEESLVLVLNHLVLWFKEKNWIRVKFLLFNKLQEMMSDVGGERDFWKPLWQMDYHKDSKGGVQGVQHRTFQRLTATRVQTE